MPRRRFSGNFRHSPRLGYHIYDDERGPYLRGGEDLWLQLWRRTTQSTHARAAAINDEGQRRRLAKYALELKPLNNSLKAVLFSRSDPRIRFGAGAFDANPRLLDVENGTIDLRLESFTFRQHRTFNMSSKIAKVSSDPATQFSEFLQFLSKILPDPDIRESLHGFLGYCLTGNASKQDFALFWGDGANGRTTLVEVVENVMGTYGIKVSFDSLLGKRLPGPSNELARLAKITAAFASEGPEGEGFDTPVLKQVARSSAVEVRGSHNESRRKPRTAAAAVCATGLCMSCDDAKLAKGVNEYQTG